MDTACAPHAKPHITTEARKADSRPHQRPTSAILKVWASALHNQLVWNPAFLRGNRRQNTKDTLPWNQLEKQVFGNVLSLHLVLSESLAVSTPEHAYLCFKRYLFCPEGHSPALESASGNITSHTHTRFSQWPIWGFPGGSAGKESASMRETWVGSLDWEDPLEKRKTTHSSILAWRIPWVTKSPTWLSDFHFHLFKYFPKVNKDFWCNSH